ncbi:MAG: hypothetical protein IJT34_00835, partial [Butyrivibrio sp.]|nr:hypothetical protein [Butyrivibrio sp.]
MITIDNGPEAYGLPSAGELEQLANAWWGEGQGAAVPAAPAAIPAVAPGTPVTPITPAQVSPVAGSSQEADREIRVAVRGADAEPAADSLYALSDRAQDSL